MASHQERLSRYQRTVAASPRSKSWAGRHPSSRLIEATLQIEGNHAARPLHLPARDRVARVALEPGVVHARHLRMGDQLLDDGAR